MPLTTGIFLRIVAEAANEQHKTGIAWINVTPFWRVIDANSKLAKKLSFDPAIIHQLRKKEKII